MVDRSQKIATRASQELGSHVVYRKTVAYKGMRAITRLAAGGQLFGCCSRTKNSEDWEAVAIVASPSLCAHSTTGASATAAARVARLAVSNRNARLVGPMRARGEADCLPLCATALFALGPSLLCRSGRITR
jgi:hypothetical protein